jgi:hypothetical protein
VTDAPDASTEPAPSAPTSPVPAEARPGGPADARGRLSPWLLPVATSVLVLLLGLRQCGEWRREVGARLNRTALSQAVVVQQVRDVAKLVSSETMVRDVVTYENTWLGSTKRSLVVVTGRLLAGVDLDEGVDVRIDSAARRIVITLPHARLLGVELTDLKTYDERSGLWNPFRPEDRDAILRQVRARLAQTGEELALSQHAEQSARQLLERLFTTDGYTTEVKFGATALAPTG